MRRKKLFNSMPPSSQRKFISPGTSSSRSRWSHCCTPTSLESNGNNLGKTSKSFQNCQLIHLQSCFAHEAGEKLRFYILKCLKEPNKMCICQFVQCVLQLNKCIEIFCVCSTVQVQGCTLRRYTPSQIRSLHATSACAS